MDTYGNLGTWYNTSPNNYPCQWWSKAPTWSLAPTSTPRPIHAACHPPPATVQLWSHQFISSVTAWHTTGREFLVPPSFVFVYSVRVLYKLTWKCNYSRKMASRRKQFLVRRRPQKGKTYQHYCHVTFDQRNQHPYATEQLFGLAEGFE